MYVEGRGVLKDQVNASEWHEKAAAQKDASFQWMLGLRFELGLGVSKDETKAVVWH